MISNKELFNALKLHYISDRKMSLHEILVTIYRPYYAPFLELLFWIRPNNCVIDIGCGTGAFLVCCHKFKSIQFGIGYDVNRKSIETASRSNKASDIKFRVGKIPPCCEIKRADAICLIDVLHHIRFEQNQNDLLKTIIKNMSSGSKLVIKDLDDKRNWRTFANRITDVVSTQSIVFYMGRSKVEALFVKSGLKILESRVIVKQFWNHYILVAEKL